MLVHAHPDDETIGNGVTMAKHVAEGGQVTLVTCTLGEEGEVLIPELVHLDAEHEDDLAPQRLKELTEAMRLLGVTDFVRLGGDGRYRDSGMAYDDKGRAIARDVLRDGIFWTADLRTAADDLVALIRDRRPQVLVAYNEIGGYGHPDHVQAHRVAMYGYLLAGVPGYRPDLGDPWTVERVLWSTMSATRMKAAVAALRAAGDEETFKGFEDAEGEMPMMSPDDEIVAAVDGTAYVAQKLDAMRAHATQILPDGTFFAGGKMSVDSMWSHEFYRFAAGTPFPVTHDSPWADDLFAGLG
ncbi:N-acetyl-1-D-myo-inositol-2-amino-2-deoxy-alpha-D-glucopyranoside deacetylase [Microlunatus flavus]|uniref:N-acetyl-1-D-myo-inositol-2-amino-2-deoxy-alpha-D-glucopyranoside deacetylase n=2 Tax=Microlunatus flavus TaxID=1036181 RepID=A0A1H9KCU1_9ACTN|nr:N-acetyl-1-D-myo-inositol-2-amino-2-deoxy-alpha-D-glucopyranoside deacetylase [Microlunatus flavus]